MARVCMRPGCDRPAEVRLSYDTVSCQVWLDPILDRPGPVQEICEFHALRLTVPRGWLLCERRVPNPALFVPGDAPEKIDPPGVSIGGDQSSSTVPLTVGAPSPRVGRRSTHRDAEQLKRRHPSETARELFPDDLAQPVQEARESDAGAERVGASDHAALEPEPAAPDEAGPATQAQPGPATDPEPAARAEAEPVVREAEPAEAETAPEAGPAADADPEAEEAGPAAEADPEAEEAVKDTRTPTSPLLARAFAQTGPQRSVLSDDLRVPDQERPRRNSR